MIDFIIGLACLIIALGIIMLRKAYFAKPYYELRRQAIKGDKYARTIYPVVAYGPLLRGLLWILLGIFSAVALVLFARLAPLWLGIILVIGWLWLAFSWLPNTKPSKFSQSLALGVTPLFNWLLNSGYPLVRQLDKITKYYPIAHTGLYEPEDLDQLVERQLEQADNRISTKQLGRIKKLLVFESAVVSTYTQPWSALMILAANDPIGPIMLDELHKSKQTSFVVTKTAKDHQVVGILNRTDVGLNSQGKVADYMHHPVVYVQEDELIESALAKFATGSQILLVVVNKDHLPIGVLTLKDALKALLSPMSKRQASSVNKDGLLMTKETVKSGGLNETTE